MIRAFAAAVPLLCLCLMVGCGDLPQPFAGRPGAAALRLANPPPARLVVPVPGGALLPPAEAALMAHDLADALVAQEVPAFTETPRTGDWQIRVSAELETQAAASPTVVTAQKGSPRLHAGRSVVTPHFEILDAGLHPKGALTGQPIQAADWASGNQAVLLRVAADAAPQITALLRSVDAAIKQSDPNSLYNRPARIYLADVTGAPGDGNRSLARQLRAKLPDTGDVLVPSAQAADFIVHGVVRKTDLGGHQQQIEIHWLVYDAGGKMAGDVAQGHDIDQGSLDRLWGDVAVAVAAEAAGGVHEVITNWSGRKHLS